ncbi:MAG: chemotaxis protein MotB [Acidimicrobiales bacterium]|nr:OmpA family protein [Hyphomonadaceae bacterium]RZV44783.1 MAG: chemotaxis protein MotB [Acidimicrobiales bacterium]
MGEEVRPIILRRKKVYAADGHHGGAWKVAYADFVTAMMAFFLLMWLLNATTEEQRKGIADYFNPNIPIAAVSGGGSGALNGDSVFAQETLARDGTGASGVKAAGHNKKKATARKTDNGPTEEINKLNAALAQEAPGIAEHIQLKMSPDGLVIELIEGNDKPLFDVGNAQPSDLLNHLLEIVAESFSSVQNSLKIVGHTDSRAYVSGATYSNWELSADRANTARRLLVAKGFPIYQIAEISGKADTDHVIEDGMAAQNRRISITILKSST